MKFAVKYVAWAVGAVIAAPSIAYAQSEGHISLEEVIVTARKTEENIQVIPVAITSLTADDLLKSSTTNVKDISNSTPSLTVTNATANPTAARVSLRGQVQNDTIFTVDPSVGIYLDEVYLGRSPGALLDLYDVQRVEILKGPQGTLYGRNTTGGALKIITTKAEVSAPLGGYVRAGFGNYNAKKVEGGVNIPLIEDRLAMRVAGLMNKRDGYSEVSVIAPGTDNIVKKVDTDNKDTGSARVDFVLSATDKLEFELNFDYSDIDTNGALTYNRRGDLSGDPIAIAAPGPFPAARNYSNYVRSSNSPYKAVSNVDPYATNLSKGGSLAATYTFDNDIVAKAVYAHRRMDGAYNFDVDGTNLPIVATTQRFGAEQDSLELQLTGSSFDALDWVTGLYGFREIGYEDSGQTALGSATFPGGAASAPYNANGENKSKSAYGQATYHLTDTVSLTGGLRWTMDEKALISHNYTSLAPTYPQPGLCNFTAGTPGVDIASCTSDQSHKYKHISWTAGIDWQMTDDVMLYAKSSNGYRAGGQNLRGKKAVELIPFDEETVTDFELGAKATLWDNRLRSNFAMYRSNYKGIQNTIFVDSGAGVTSTQVVNLTDAVINGAELEVTAQVLEELVITATGSYTDTQFDSLTGADEIQSFPQGLQSIYTPRWKYSIGGTYTQPLSVGDLSFNVNYAWRDSYYINASKALNQTPEASTEAIGLVNARLQLEFANIETTVGVWGSNLADKGYNTNNL
ncbi:MAG: TonB-dependent receptor, partial [Spongiibacteraceae bacterium]